MHAAHRTPFPALRPHWVDGHGWYGYEPADDLDREVRDLFATYRPAPVRPIRRLAAALLLAVLPVVAHPTPAVQPEPIRAASHTPTAAVVPRQRGRHAAVTHA